VVLVTGAVVGATLVVVVEGVLVVDGAIVVDVVVVVSVGRGVEVCSLVQPAPISSAMALIAAA
jgi:hypothetical protein